MHNEFNFKIGEIRNKKTIGLFFDYLIPKILQNQYPDKLKKFDLNIVHRNEHFPKKVYYEYLDENTHWSNLLETIQYIASYNSKEQEQIKNLLLDPNTKVFYTELEQGIIKMIDMFKPKAIYSH